MTPASPNNEEDRKSKYCPSPEEIQLHVAYGFNLNVDPNCLKKQSFPQQYEFYVTQLDRFMHSQIELVNYPELSHKGKLHVHGYIKFKTYLAVAEFYLQLLNYPHHLYIHTIDDPDKRETYMTKSEHIMRPLCEKYGKEYIIHTKVPVQMATIIKSFHKNKNI